MSRDIFDERLREGLARKSEHYESAVPYSQELVKILAGTYFTDAENNRTDQVEVFTELLASHHVESFEPQAFIDAVIAEACKLDPFPPITDAVFSSLVQALYEHGYNRLSLDFTYLQTDKKTHLANNMSGTKEKPLVASFKGVESDWFANYAEHCHLRIEDYADDVASEAASCDIELALGASVIGVGAESCVFRFPLFVDGEVAMPLTRGSANLNGSRLRFTRLEYSLYLAKGSDDCTEILLYKGFFEKGNKILIPDQDNPGQWKEVTP